MKAINNITWSKFHIEDFFDIVGSVTTHPSVLIQGGSTPRITCSATNNGLDTFYQNQPTEGGNVLTADSATVGFISYQEYPFLATDHVEKLVFTGNTKFNRYIALFFKLCIDKAKANKFGYGYKFSQTRIKRQTIMLPIDENGQPDYAYMEAYMKEVEKRLLAQYKTFLDKKMQKAESSIGNSSQVRWKAFDIHHVFPEIQRGKRLKTDDHILGNMAYVSSSAMNNGVDNFVSNSNGVRIFGNCLTLANSGSVGTSFYHPYRFVASDHVTKMQNLSFNKYVYLFIATISNRLSEKYSFNREINDRRLSREKIMLPVDENGNPDYAYMERFMMKKEASILNRYISNRLTE